MKTIYAIQEPVSYIIRDTEITQTAYNKIIRDGPKGLSIQELLSLSMGESESSIGHIQEYGTHSLTALNSVEEATHSLGINQKDAVQLLVTIELGRRLFQKTSGSLVRIRGIQDVFDHFRSMALLPKEQLRALLVNSRYQLVHDELLGVGSIESLHISAKDVFQAAVERRISAILLVHNHPSGDSTPSKADRDFTAEMVRIGEILGIQVLDHVVIAENGFASCLNTGH
jgi:DNA repair protein RadC